MKNKSKRRRRAYSSEKEGKTSTRFQMSLNVIRNGNGVLIEFWSDSPNLPEEYEKGRDVEIPVTVRTYMQNGMPKHRLTIIQQSGEPF